MAEMNKVNKKQQKELSAFQKEQVETIKKIESYKISAEANIVSAIYKEPEEIYNVNLSIDDFKENMWRVYWQIAEDIIVIEGKKTLDPVTIEIYLDKHPQLKARYFEYGGYDSLVTAMEGTEVSNLQAYVTELKKWIMIIDLCKRGFPVKDRLSDYVTMSEDEIYNELEANLNHVFANSSFNIKSYDVLDGMKEFIETMDKKKDVGIPFSNADLLTRETGGFNLNGNIYGLGAASGVGKSTMAFNYLVPSALECGEPIVFIINEEDQDKMRKELLVWVANNKIKKKVLTKEVLRNGGFDDETKELLLECAKWIEEQGIDKKFVVIPLEKYSVNIAIKIIKKYSSMGVRMFVLDTLKESFDANNDNIWQSMMRDMVALYDVVKPSAKNVGLFVTYQLGKGSLKLRYLTNNEIGQAKSIVDVMSVNLMMRRLYEDEYKDGDKEIKCKTPFTEDGNRRTGALEELRPEHYPMVTFITKNRFGTAGEYQIVSKCDLSTNVHKDIGYCNIYQDF